MIEECNFKFENYYKDLCCKLTQNSRSCVGEDECILFQIYKHLAANDYATKEFQKVYKDKLEEKK